MATTKSIDMTCGSIWRHLILFAAPLLLGNLFQQLYNTVDSVVVGNFVGDEALAAMGCTTSICNTMIYFFNGISIGAGIIISNYFGAQNWKKLHQAIETAVLTAVVLGLAVSLLSLPVVPFMLRLMHTPADVIGPAGSYLRIYFLGTIFLFCYNIGSGILRAVGDTQTPLKILIMTSLLNIVLDLFFVVVLDGGIAGAATATVLAEAVSAAATFAVLCRAEEAVRLNWRDLRIDGGILKSILTLGMPVAIQQSLTSFSNAFVQGYINSFESTAIMAGWSSYLKLDQFSLLPVISMGQATTTFVGQNLGAGNKERARKGTRYAILMGCGVIAVICTILGVFAKDLVSLFNQEPEVIYYGTQFIWMSLPFRFCGVCNQTLAGALRGGGDARGPMLIMLFSFVFCRQAYLFVVTQFAKNIYTVGFGYPFGWIVCCVMSVGYYLWKLRRDEKTLGLEEQPDTPR